MPNETLSAERAQRSARTDGLRFGGGLWVLAGVICLGLFVFVFVREGVLTQNPSLSAMVLGGAVAALLTGGLLLSRPGRGVVRWSSVLGVAWLLAFGSLWVTSLKGSEGGPMLSSGLIAGFGVAAALITFWAGRSWRRLA